MSVKLMLDYISSKVSMAVGVVVSGPLAIFAAVQSEWILIPIGIAGGVCAFVWGVRKFPINDLIENAKKAIDENFRLKERNAKLAEENEHLRVRVAHYEEDSKTIHVPPPKPDK